MAGVRRIRGMIPVRRTFAIPRLPILLGLLALAGCSTIQTITEEILDSRTPRERYVDAMTAAGLDGTALAADWLAAAEHALTAAPPVQAPHQEIGYLVPAEPAAIAFQVEARRGQEIHFSLELPGDSTTLIFLDAWELPDSGAGGGARLVASADSLSRTLVLEPRRDGAYILRAQPELLRGGRFTATVRLDPTLAFPVSGRRESDVGSRFGADRDGGRRSHHGVDIFAPRGTPVVAASPGIVNRVGTNNLGGLIVWVRDDFGNRLYYAHLDSQSVTSGQRVEVGDTLGTVGNTGNARTTPPHLHFGVYRRGEGPVDPWWFIHQPRGTPPRLVADTASLGEWVRVRADLAVLREAPAARADSLRALDRHTTARVIAAVGEWYRVRLPDGTAGYLSARSMERAGTAIAAADFTPADSVLARPDRNGRSDVVLSGSPAIERMDVFGRFEGFLMVRTPDGGHGWLEGS